ncbi:uncharacterized protein DSM5745_08044 [Aspergillus mulundensis]|uniref:Xylanolytic transcriptional activator regulatory domain-containing protein n=1 Tax=Aspergillus mulundensis TaxID=1810919 RepID=A0A3D8R8Z8_9EURO|nr:hypothetical protein DSM5745_08044 [Aspergillus mulundensis]RDW70533.1 hypothetical protein DSM5745_08044 [Aspergillus mulundensis]
MSRNSLSSAQSALGRFGGTITSRPSGPEKIQHFLNLYFDIFSPHWPFIHRASFTMNQSNESPLLVQSMLVIGMWVADTASIRAAAVELHGKLGEAISEQRKKWDLSAASGSPGTTPQANPKFPLPMYQAILLHIIFTLLHKGNGGSEAESKMSLALDLTLALKSSPLTARDLTLSLLSSLVQSCRRLGMFHYPSILTVCRESPDEHTFLPHAWVSVEEVKRFNVALWRVCRAISGRSWACPPTGRTDAGAGAGAAGGGVDGRQGNAKWELRAAELRFPLPTNDAMWAAQTWEEWDSAVARGRDEDVDVDADVLGLGDYREDEWISVAAGMLELLG